MYDLRSEYWDVLLIVYIKVLGCLDPYSSKSSILFLRFKVHCGELQLRLPSLVLESTPLERLVLNHNIRGQSQIEVLKLLSKHDESFSDISRGFSLLHLTVDGSALAV